MRMIIIMRMILIYSKTSHPKGSKKWIYNKKTGYDEPVVISARSLKYRFLRCGFFVLRILKRRRLIKTAFGIVSLRLALLPITTLHDEAQIQAY